MKVRLHDDSLRLRLSPAEVAALGRGEAVTSTTPLGPGAALAVAVAVDDVRQTTAAGSGAGVTVTLPRSDAVGWAEDDREGLYAEQDAGGGRTLRIAVEKDYACGHRAPADAATFARPDA